MIVRLKALLYFIYMFLLTLVRGYMRWKRPANLGPGAHVYYGHDKIPERGEKTSGGIVKCQDLSREYPNTLQGSNILYLVSSALPPFPELLVWMAKRRGVKLVVNQNGVAIPAYHGNNLEPINGPRRYLLRHADHVIYQSGYCKRSADTFLTSEVHSSSILLNPVDVAQFPDKGRGLDGNGVVLLLAGSHGRFYRVQAALEVLRCLKAKGVEVRLEVIGRLAWKDSEEECVAEVLQYCEDAGVADVVSIGGPYSQDEAAVLYRRADILLHTQYNDACPRVVVEAMASGLPVVYSASGGVAELVGPDAGIGIAVPDDWNQIHLPDPEKMASGVVRVIGEYECYSKNARERVLGSLDVYGWMERHRELFESLHKNP